MLIEIKKNPLLYIGDRNFSKLKFFIDGYLTCAQEHNDFDSIQCFENLKIYIEKSFSPVITNDSYYSYIKKSCESESAALEKFFELFNKFIAKNDIELNNTEITETQTIGELYGQGIKYSL